MFNTVAGKKITLLGWAFKKDTNDTRESAAIYIADYLIENGAEIHVYDPKVSKERMIADLGFLNTRSTLKNKQLLNFHASPYTACHQSHAISIITEWDEFADYDWQIIYSKMIKPAKIFDGRNILNTEEIKKIGFEVYSVGKAII